MVCLMTFLTSSRRVVLDLRRTASVGSLFAHLYQEHIFSGNSLAIKLSISLLTF